MPRFIASKLETWTAELFVAAGVSRDEAAVVAASLVESNLRGHDSHGVIRVAEYVEQLGTGQLVAGGSLRMLAETPAMIAGDGGRGFGQVLCRRLIELVGAKAREQGVACGTLMHCGHVGRLGEWVELAACGGLAGLISVNDNGVAFTVAPPGGIAPRISTNPIAIGVPTDAEPLVLDISTSAVANGKIKVARLAGREVPPGWIQDAAGNPTTDPNVMLADPPGTLLPFGGDQGYKAFGLGLLLDILVAGLSGGFSPPAPSGILECNNVLLVLWDPARFAGHEHFRNEAAKLIAAVRDTPRKPGVARIQLPGDRSAEIRRERLAQGIPLEGDNWETLVRLARKLEVPVPTPL
jgi:uncharacterized oxidoreductase